MICCAWKQTGERKTTNRIMKELSKEIYILLSQMGEYNEWRKYLLRDIEELQSKMNELLSIDRKNIFWTEVEYSNDDNQRKETSINYRKEFKNLRQFVLDVNYNSKKLVCCTYAALPEDGDDVYKMMRKELSIYDRDKGELVYITAQQIVETMQRAVNLYYKEN